ncbi:putative peptidyl-prolyl cis-trans isomerase B-like [Capsicum annuum]|uniref:uncharacterized protein LOC107862152 isoform X1 n=2 Tax=Capsicum annuum TaxID=4072 RepID=UPI001FB18A7F|nr:uncharacterized protein LOC107862152 isoform X1 [Capsicum annuum]KAF3673905.1 putative peptidyl-prolyl cis-trans isomerase B-like [Capsicum annuum]
MAEDSQKRFQDAMDKLFRTPPKSNSSSPSRVQLSRGRKRPDMSVIGKGVGKQNLLLGSSKGGCSGEGKAPCRPWDRDDLFRRMSTFKSMTWFAKPQAISAVNCARRGWVNVDMDTIACEACGSRMLFSTPPSWTQQQVDKAASVFSLKLDSGHKLLCPWIDNACDEKLADFPPTVTAVLVDQYKIRHSVLSQLAALPVISAKAIDFLKNPQLEQFLRESLTVELDGSMQTPQQEDTRNESTSASSLTYYQAQKLISLCGWELRSLPYFVDPKDQPNQSSKDANISDKSILSGKSQTITPYSSCTDKTSEKKPDDDNQASEEAVINPNSVVLDCKLCGACIGLWDFSMVSRPLEFLRVSGYTQVNNDHITGDGKSLLSGNSDHDESRERIGHVATSANTMLDRGPPNFNLTIAGGPPPAMHNYRAKISLPIIGRNLRAWFSSESEHKDDLVTKCSSDLSKNPECLAGENTAEGTSLSTSEAITEAQLENSQAAAQDSGNITEMADNAESLNKVDPAVMDHCKDKVGNDFGLSGKDSVTSCVGESGESRVIVEVNNFTQGGEQGYGNGVNMAAVRPLIHDISPSRGKELQILSADKALEFDPFKLHRYFCPWIASNGGSPPGWEQTLSALDRHAESSPLSSFAPSSLIKVGDPVASVQKLFTSVQPKRRKLVRPS